MKIVTLLLLTIWTLFKCSTGIAQVNTCPVMGDFDLEIRETNPRVDGYHHINTPLLIQRLINARMNSYMYLIQHSPATDWSDFVNEFMPAAQIAGLNIWIFLVPPSEGGPIYPYNTASGYSIDSAYVTWARAIAVQANNFSNIKGFIIDDFNSNLSVFTPSFVLHMRQEARAICPSLTLDVINYYEDITSNWLFDYANCIDGIVFPYTDLDSSASLLNQITNIQLLITSGGFEESTSGVPDNINTKKLSLIVIIYAFPTSWHPVPPTTNYIRECLSIVHLAVTDSLANGMVTYCLDKSTDTSTNYVAVKDLYTQWQCSSGIQVFGNAESMLKIYPNPAGSIITIESRQPEVIEISNMQGQVIKTLALKGHKTNIDISVFPDGLYTIKAITDGKIAVQGFIKQ